MNGVYFNDLHSYRDLCLILAPFTITPAEPQTNFLKVPGRDGILDLTESNGEVKFNSREFLFTFTIMPDDELLFEERVAISANALNGQKVKITLEKDPQYYWVGRCTIDKYAQNKRLGQIVVKATVDPYKLRQEETEWSYDLTTSEREIVLFNRRMPSIPTIKCTHSNTVITFEGNIYTLNAGTHKILGIRLVEGGNVLKVSGSGTITFTWQEGEL